ncbi:MAG TPA: tyrosine-type recombinase/integrase [Candidatus Cybelea sp.]|nr:tyrosine-type recombinase/integrase [Candidatus Cybelea sp.]
MARRRYQEGSLYLRKGKRRTVWVGRWLEDVIEDGRVRRVHRKEVLGTIEDFPTEKLARRELDARLAPVNAVGYRPRPAATFAEFASRWEITVLTQHKPSTQATIRSQIRKYFRPSFGAYQMRAIQAEDLQRLLSGVRLNPKTVRNLFTTFQMMWKSARAWRYAAHDVTLGIVLPKRRRPRNSFFSLEEVQRIIAAADGPYRAFYWIAAEAGLRRGELCGLRVDDLDLQAGRLEVRQSVWHGRIQSPKSENAYRSLSLSPELVEHLRGFILKWQPNERRLLFATRNGTPWDGNLVVRRKLRPLLSSLGIEARGLHAFRHANTTMMDRWNVPLKVRQERLGQSDPRLTLGVYTHVASEDEVRTASKLGKAISGRILCPDLPN